MRNNVVWILFIILGILWIERYNLWKLAVCIKYTIQKIPLKIKRNYYNFIIWLIDEIKKGKQH